MPPSPFPSEPGAQGPPAVPPGGFTGPGPHPPATTPGWFAAPGQYLPPPPPPRRRTGLLIGVLAAVVLVVGGGVTWLLVSKNSTDTDTAQDAAHALAAALDDRDVDAWNTLTCDDLHVSTDDMAELDANGAAETSVTSVETINETSATATLTLTNGTETESETFEMTRGTQGWTFCTSGYVQTEQGG